MDNNELKLYSSMANNYIDPKIFDLVPLTPQKIYPYKDECIIWETTRGNWALWIYGGQESRLAYQNQILKVCQQKGIKNFLYPLSLNDGRSYARFDERHWFYITDWPEFRDISFRNQVDLFSLVDLIGTFRKIIADSGIFLYLPEQKKDFNLLNAYHEMIQSLNSLALVAKFRLKPTRFDQLFLNYLPEVIIQSNRATSLLKESDYRSLSAKVTTQNIVLNRFNRANLRFSMQAEVASVLRFNNYRWDLPIIDLAALLVKTGRSSKWSVDWFHNIITEYQKYFPTSISELEIIFSYLTFPWNFYRLIARYYFNLMEWSPQTFVEKMERLLDEENHRVKFLTIFRQHFIPSNFSRIN